MKREYKKVGKFWRNIIVLSVLLFIGGSLYINSADKVNSSDPINNASVISEVNDIEVSNISHDDDDDILLNEKDFYKDNKKDDLVISVPMKAYQVFIDKIEYYVLTDLKGSFELIDSSVNGYENLQNRKNVVAYIDKSDKEILNIGKIGFKFTYESEFNDHDYIQEEIDMIVADYMNSLYMEL